MMGFTPETEETRELQKTWENARSCRYLRGHEPDDMRMPDQDRLSDFVFGRAELPPED